MKLVCCGENFTLLYMSKKKKNCFFVFFHCFFFQIKTGEGDLFLFGKNEENFTPATSEIPLLIAKDNEITQISCGKLHSVYLKRKNFFFLLFFYFIFLFSCKDNGDIFVFGNTTFFFFIFFMKK